MAGEFAAVISLIMAFVLGYFVFEFLGATFLRGDWLFLRTRGERMRFFLWPFVPENIVKITLIDGTQRIYFNIDIIESKDEITIITPLGMVTAPEKASIPLPLTSIHLPGRASPLMLALAGLMAVGSVWILNYYIYVLIFYRLFGYDINWNFITLVLVLAGYVLLYLFTLIGMRTEYHSYDIIGLAPPGFHAIPSTEIAPPLKIAKYYNQPIIIRITDRALEALEETKRIFRLEKNVIAAEFMAIAELYHALLQKIEAMSAKQARLTEEAASDRNWRERFKFQFSEAVGEITMTKVLLALGLVGIGFLLGWALHGTIVVVPGGGTPQYIPDQPGAGAPYPYYGPEPQPSPGYTAVEQPPGGTQPEYPRQEYNPNGGVVVGTVPG